MSKAGKKIMDKRERDFAQSQISSSLPPSIPKPGSQKDVRVTKLEEFGRSTPPPSIPADLTPSFEFTIKDVPIKYEPLMGDGEAIVVHKGDVVAKLNPGPLTMDDAFELSSVASEHLHFPSFAGNDCEFTEEEIKEKLRKAAEETVSNPPGPELSHGEEEAELAEAHEGRAQGSGAEAGRGDEDGGSEESGDCQEHA
jgi:hypothetical protein